MHNWSIEYSLLSTIHSSWKMKPAICWYHPLSQVIMGCRVIYVKAWKVPIGVKWQVHVALFHVALIYVALTSWHED